MDRLYTVYFMNYLIVNSLRSNDRIAINLSNCLYIQYIFTSIRLFTKEDGMSVAVVAAEQGKFLEDKFQEGSLLGNFGSFL